MKILTYQKAVSSEIAFFMLTETDDPFFITDVQVVKQHASWAKFEFDDEAMAIFMAEQYELGICPDQCRRIVGHTHPGDSAMPSQDDMSEFKDHFEGMDWHIMFIRAQGGKYTCKLRIRTVPSAHLESNQTLMWMDRELPLFIMAPTKYHNDHPRHGLDDWPTDELLAMYDTIKHWTEEARALCTPFPQKDPHYGNGHTPRTSTPGVTTYEATKGKEVLEGLDEARVTFLLGHDPTLEIPWDDIGARYSMTLIDIEDLEDSHGLDPQRSRAIVEDNEMWMAEYETWLKSDDGKAYLKAGGTANFGPWVHGNQVGLGPDENEDETDLSDTAEMDAIKQTYGLQD